MTEPKKQLKGFAVMSPEAIRIIASKGGKAAHAAGTAHEWDRKTAAEAGRKGGIAASADRERMARIGRKGGKHRHGRPASEGIAEG